MKMENLKLIIENLKNVKDKMGNDVNKFDLSPWSKCQLEKEIERLQKEIESLSHLKTKKLYLKLTKNKA